MGDGGSGVPLATNNCDENAPFAHRRNQRNTPPRRPLAPTPKTDTNAPYLSSSAAPSSSRSSAS
eukprot:7510845-Alexandrium_andersonii.AAC.1